MTKTVDVGPLRLVTIEAEKRRVCQQCGAAKETRPYGLGGARICFDCAMKDKEGTEKRMGQVLFGSQP